ncbi:MAG: class I SAM-dependent methyltransferase [Clostridia bacterium]|nr:class I SAM-dependent methyltransferase [Clostridia bacterium]
MSFASAMAHFYDRLNDGADYTSERALIASHLPEGTRTGLDLGCGTGDLAILLSGEYQMTAVDLSEEMLSAADAKAFAARRSVRFVHQDITALSLGVRFDFALCLHDTLNYVLKTEALSEVFCRTAEHLNDEGVFIFDLSKKERFENEYGNSAEVLERDGLFCTWEKAYHKERAFCDFVFHFFEENGDGTYTRSVEYERQRLYAPKTVEKLCTNAGFGVERIAETDTHYIYKAIKRG